MSRLSFVLATFIAALVIAGAAQAQVPDHNCEMPTPGTPAYSYWVLHGFGLPRAPAGYYYPQGSCTAIPIPGYGQPSRPVYPQQAVQNETVESDQAWESEDANGACSRLHDRRRHSPADIAACHNHYASQPQCLDYKGFASVWFDMRKTQDDAFQYQPQMLASMGTGVGDRDVAIYRSPEYRAKLQRLLSVVQTMDQSKWKSGSSFAAVAYKRCMVGNPF